MESAKIKERQTADYKRTESVYIKMT